MVRAGEVIDAHILRRRAVGAAERIGGDQRLADCQYSVPVVVCMIFGQLRARRSAHRIPSRAPVKGSVCVS